MADDSAHARLDAPYETTSRSTAAFSVRRLLVRSAVALALLVSLDVALATRLPDSRFQADWRMPRTMPTSELGPALAHLERRSQDDVAVTFTGASPTWGDAVENASETAPAAFRRVAEESGTPVFTLNLASNGQFVADQFFIADAALDSSDLMFVQLTYDVFGTKHTDPVHLRYPELPALTGARVDEEMARVLGVEPSPAPDLTGAADRALRRSWRAYGSRDIIAARILGTSPEQYLFTRWERVIGKKEAPAAEKPDAANFDEMPIEDQMRMAADWRTDGDYTFDPGSSEAVMLGRLCDRLRESGKPAIIYVAPFNFSALDFAGMIDYNRYDANIAAIREVVESRGVRFVDLNAEPLPSASFYDINHTTAEGAEQTARLLWDAANPELQRAGAGGRP